MVDKVITPAKYLELLARGTFETAKDARRIFEAVSPMMNGDQEAEALALISRMEIQERLDKEGGHYLLDILPEGWIREYVKFNMAGESPLIFHAMLGFAVVGHVLGRRRRKWLMGNPIYAPVNVFLVSPAGMAGRGESFAVAERVARKAGCNLITDEFTPEGLFTALMESPHALIMNEEAATTLSKKDYQSDMSSKLCRILDCVDSGIARLLKGEGAIRTPPLTVNAAFSSSPGMFESMPREALSGGLWSRFIIVYEHMFERSIPFPEDVTNLKWVADEEQHLVDWLREIRRRTKEKKDLEYRGAAKNRFQSWYRDNRKKMRSASDELQSWYSRKRPHVHRIVMCMLESNFMGNIATADILDRALALFDVIEEKMVFAYRHASPNLNNKRLQAILDSIQRAGGRCDHSKLYRRTHHVFKDASSFKEALQEGLDLGLITKKMESAGAGKRPKAVYYITGMGASCEVS